MDASPAPTSKRKKKRSKADLPAGASGDEAEDDESKAGDETDAERFVREMTVSVTGVPEATTLIGVRNVTRGALVRFSGQVYGPMAKRIKLIRKFPTLWQR